MTQTYRHKKNYIVNCRQLKKLKSRKKIIITPLDWGLGHASRCIPIINALMDLGIEIYMAGSGRSGLLLQKEFPQLAYKELPWPNIKYHNNGRFEWAIARQTPKIIAAIKQENKIINDYIIQHKIDGIISDNRYGCWSAHIPSVIISHQLKLLMPTYLMPLEIILNKLSYNYISKFSNVWIPDETEPNDLSGILSKPHWLHKLNNVERIGLLSRCYPIDLPKKYELAIILSGQEPQRTLLEQKLLKQVALLPDSYNCILVRGITEGSDQPLLMEKITSYDYLTTTALNEVLNQSEIIIARSGYSTIMDLIKLRKKALLVPTPGQTEQEYLANYLSKKKIFHTVEQDKINLKSDLDLLCNATQPLLYTAYSTDLSLHIKSFIASL